MKDDEMSGMTDDEKRATVEFFLDCAKRYAEGYGGSFTMEDGCYMNEYGPQIARAYLAEHPSDDAEPVDATWVDGIGWARSYDAYWPTGDRTILLVVKHDAKPVLSYAGLVVAGSATRGHVRRLAAAIGRPLAPTTAPSD